MDDPAHASNPDTLLRLARIVERLARCVECLAGIAPFDGISGEGQRIMIDAAALRHELEFKQQ